MAGETATRANNSGKRRQAPQRQGHVSTGDGSGFVWSGYCRQGRIVLGATSWLLKFSKSMRHNGRFGLPLVRRRLRRWTCRARTPRVGPATVVRGILYGVSVLRRRAQIEECARAGDGGCQPSGNPTFLIKRAARQASARERGGNRLQLQPQLQLNMPNNMKLSITSVHLLGNSLVRDPPTSKKKMNDLGFRRNTRPCAAVSQSRRQRLLIMFLPLLAAF